MRQPFVLGGWLNVLVCAAYYTVFNGMLGATLGKAVVGLRVLRRDGRPLGIPLAFLRYVAYLIVAKLFYGAFTMPFDRERRALHDFAAGTNVYRVP